MGKRIAVVLAVVAVSAIVACKPEVAPIVDPMPPDSPPVGSDAPLGICGASTLHFQQEICTDNSQCGTCECRTVGHEMKCNNACDGPEDCPSPSHGCDLSGAGPHFCRE